MAASSSRPSSPPAVLVFAGADPTGGAGLQADILALASLGCHPLPVITAITVQDTLGVEDFLPIDPEWIADQARSVLEDIPVAAIKLGMLGSAETVAAIAEVLADYPDIPLVVDPVLSSGRGDPLASEDMIAALCDLILPQATLVTPNSLEARRLAEQIAGEAAEEGEEDDDTRYGSVSVDLGDDETFEAGDEDDGDEGDDDDVRDADAEVADAPLDLKECAHRLIELGCEFVLITGAHEQGQEVINTLYNGRGVLQKLRWDRLPGSYHGSGCTLASAMAACLAQGMDIGAAAQEAQEYTWQSLKHAFRPGMGQFVPDRLFWAREGLDAADAEADPAP